LLGYFKKSSERRFIKEELNKLLPIETEKNNLAVKVLDNL
jgi:hypothetical protein